MKRWSLLFATPLLVLAAPAWAADSWMVGSWFGYGQPTNKSEMWLEVVSPDGKLHVRHRGCVQGKAFDQAQDGTWSIKGDIITLRIEKLNGQAVPPRTDVYRVLSHTQTRQTYRYEATGFVYNSRKVDGKFQLPPCDLAS
jgi:hypothetical protein